MSRFYPKIDNFIPCDVRGKRVERAYPAHFKISAANATAQDLVACLAATALTTEAQTIITGLANPAVPRSLRVKGNAANEAGNAVITGTNYNNETITETIALNGATAVEGTKAFKTITSVVLPALTTAGDTVSIGFGNKLGLPYKLAHNTVLFACRDNARESTAPTVTTSTSALESNTVLLNSALNGTAVDVYLLV